MGTARLKLSFVQYARLLTVERFYNAKSREFGGVGTRGSKGYSFCGYQYGNERVDVGSR